MPVRRALVLGALTLALTGGTHAAAKTPLFSVPVPFAQAGPLRVSVQDAALRGVATGTVSKGRLTLLAPAVTGRVFPPDCQGARADLPGVLAGSVSFGAGPRLESWRPVPSGLVPGLTPSGAPGKGAALLFLKRSWKGEVRLDCSQPGGPRFSLSLAGAFPAGWSRARTLVQVERGGPEAAVVVVVSPETGPWRWERTRVPGT